MMQSLSARLPTQPRLTSRRAQHGAPSRGLRVRAAAIPVPAEFSKARGWRTPGIPGSSFCSPYGISNSIVSQVVPLGERVVVKVAAAETKTTGGILLPTDAQRRPTTGERLSRHSQKLRARHSAYEDARAHPEHQECAAGDVIGVGKGCKSLKAGDTVVYSKWGIGVTDLAMQGNEYAVLRELDIIGTFPSTGADAAALCPPAPLPL